MTSWPISSWNAYLKDFLSAAQVTHNKNSPTLDLGSNTFTRPLPKEAKMWGKDRVAALFGPAILPPATPQRGPTASQASSPDSVAAFTAALSQFASNHGTPAATTPAADQAMNVFKQYRMSVPDLDHTLTMCGLAKGQEGQLPSWYEWIATPKILNNEKNIVRDLFDQIPFEDY